MRALAFASVLLLVAGCGDTDTADYDAAEMMEDEETVQNGEGWTTLFDGTSMDHFRGFNREDVPGSWSIKDSVLVFDPEGGDGGDLITREEYADFELMLEWRVSEAGNSGIIYRASEEYDAPWMTGPEYQILDNDAHPDAAFGDDRKAGANYDMHPTDPAAVRPVGEWNEARIVARGALVEHWLNGVKVVEYDMDSDDWKARHADSKWVDYPAYGSTRSGHIALQDHSDVVAFRNIRIQRL